METDASIGAAQQNPWGMVQDRLRTVLDDHSFKNWFSQTTFVSYADGVLRVGVPTQFFADWLRDHYLDNITDCMREVLTDDASIEFVPSPTAKKSGAKEEKLPTPVSPSEPVQVIERPNGFNPRYTFERFVVGSGNRFAHAAARAVAAAPAKAYNPLFLYGGTGLGKTHLMQAIAHEILRDNPDANITFVSSEHFTNKLIDSIQKKSTMKFRAKYRKVDVLLIDDIHFISGKEATQEEFFHTFNALFDSHKQIIIASDRQPKEIQGIEERLISRFEWGLVTDITPPDLETRVAILQARAAEDNITVPPEVLKYIATYVTANIRDLEGALTTVLAFSKLTEQPITMQLTQEVLSDLIGRDKIQPTTADAIQRAVAEHFDVRISDLKGPSRQRQVAYPRQIAMFLCKDMVPSLSLNEIGEAFGGRDHTTVLYACQKIAEAIKTSSETAQLVTQIQRLIRQ
jgi:chromosomal replication initiator protein